MMNAMDAKTAKTRTKVKFLYNLCLTSLRRSFNVYVVCIKDVKIHQVIILSNVASGIVVINEPLVGSFFGL